MGCLTMGMHLGNVYGKNYMWGNERSRTDDFFLKKTVLILVMKSINQYIRDKRSSYLSVVGLEPQRLHLRVVARRERVRLEYPVELGKVLPVERDDRLGLEHRLVLLQVLARRQGPQEPRQPVVVAALLQDLADARDLLLREPERRHQRRRRRRRGRGRGRGRDLVLLLVKRRSGLRAGGGG